MRPHEYKLKKKPRTYIVTVSTSRYEKLKKGEEVDDPSGDLAEHLLRKEGIKEIKRILIKDDSSMIKKVIRDAQERGVNLIIFIGGTGVSQDDVTIETIKPFFKKELTAFQVLFTLYSMEEVGSRAISSRSTAGFIDDILVFALPGSKNAVETALSRIILKEYEHLLYIAGILE